MVRKKYRCFCTSPKRIDSTVGLMINWRRKLATSITGSIESEHRAAEKIQGDKPQGCIPLLYLYFNALDEQDEYETNFQSEIMRYENNGSEHHRKTVNVLVRFPKTRGLRGQPQSNLLLR